MSNRTTFIPEAASRLYRILKGRFDKNNPLVFPHPVTVVKETRFLYSDDGTVTSVPVRITSVYPSASSITVTTDQGGTDGIHVFDSFSDDKGPDSRWLLDELESEVNRAVRLEKEILIQDIREFVGEGGLVAFEHGFKPSVNMYSVDGNGIHRTVPDGSGGKKHSFVPFEEMDENTIKEIIINLFRYLNYCHLYA